MILNLNREQEQILKQIVSAGIKAIKAEAHEIVKDLNKPALFRRACEEELAKFEEVASNIIRG